MKKKNKIEILLQIREDPIAREMIEHTEEISGTLVSGYKKCTL